MIRTSRTIIIYQYVASHATVLLMVLLAGPNAYSQTKTSLQVPLIPAQSAIDSDAPQPAPADQGLLPMSEYPPSPDDAALESPHFRPCCPSPVEWRCGVFCDDPTHRRRGPGWSAQRPIPWQVFAQGEYVGPPRIAHVPEYRLRVDDIIEFVYRLTAKQSSRPYRLEVGDRIRVTSLSAHELDQEVAIQPDGTITLQFLGQVAAGGRTIDELRAALNEQYLAYLKSPEILVVPLKFNTRLEELRSSVDARYGTGGQREQVRVTPEGTVQLPALGSVYVQGLTLSEVKREVDERYAQMVDGIELTPILVTRAPRYVFVLGEVRTPGRYVLEGPTTAMQAIAMAGSWNVGAHLEHLVIFRRDDCWRLMATKVNLHGALFGTRPCPSGEIWLRDSDIILVPKNPLLATDDLINLVFTRGIYAVLPVSATLNYTNLSTL